MEKKTNWMLMEACSGGFNGGKSPTCCKKIYMPKIILEIILKTRGWRLVATVQVDANKGDRERNKPATEKHPDTSCQQMHTPD